VALSVLGGRALILAVVTAAATPDILTDEALADRIARIAELNKHALAEIDRGAVDAARKHLLEAERLAAAPELATHPLVGRTYLHLGVVEVISGGPQRRVDELFGKAVQVVPDIQMTRELSARAPTMAAIARAMSALERVRCQQSHSDWTCPWDEAADPEPPARVARFECRGRADVPAAKPVVIRCAANPALHVAEATLFYENAWNGSPNAKLTELTMRRNERGWWTATIPAERVIPKGIQFHSEAMDAGGRRVTSSVDEQTFIFRVETAEACWCKSRLPDQESASAGRH
jgi:hypothetical protein